MYGIDVCCIREAQSTGGIEMIDIMSKREASWHIAAMRDEAWSSDSYTIDVYEYVVNNIAEDVVFVNHVDGWYSSVDDVMAALKSRYGRVPGGIRKLYRDDGDGHVTEIGFVHSYWNDDGVYQIDHVRIFSRHRSYECTNKQVLLDDMRCINNDEVDSFVSIDSRDTLLMIDEAIADLVAAKSTISYVGSNSDHVHKATFDRFVRDVDDVVKELLGVCVKVFDDYEEHMNV